MKYRIVAAVKPWHRSKFVIEKKSWWWPFWREADNFSYPTIEMAQSEIEYLKTNISV